MPSANADAQPLAGSDGTVPAEPTPLGFIAVGAASTTPTLGASAKSLEEMDERQLATQVCFGLLD